MELNSNKVRIAGENSPEIQAFRAEINKAAGKIENSDIKKRGRGRPRKEEVEARMAEEQAAAETALEEAVPKESLAEILKAPFGIMAMGTGFDGFQLTDDEANRLVPSFHVVMKKYAPQIDPESMAVAAFGMGIVSLASVKYRAYQAWKQKPPEENNSPSNPTHSPVVSTPMPIPGSPL